MMFQRTTRVNGDLFNLGSLGERDIVPGALVCCRHARKAYRVVAEDDGEIILRNLRHPDMLDAVRPEWLLSECCLITPVAEGC